MNPNQQVSPSKPPEATQAGEPQGPSSPFGRRERSPDRSWRRRWHEPPPEPTLVFSPWAWLKLTFFLHAGEGEVGGFAISRSSDLLYVEQFVTVKQAVSSVTVEFDDAAVADYFDRCVDQALRPDQFARIWCHTHPGDSAQPSGTDEETFERVFGNCNWAVMFIVSRGGQTYARLSLRTGPGAHVRLKVAVDWESWPHRVLDQSGLSPEPMQDWGSEFEQNVHPAPSHFGHHGSLFDDPWDSLGGWDAEGPDPAQAESVQAGPRQASLSTEGVSHHDQEVTP